MKKLMPILLVVVILITFAVWPKNLTDKKDIVSMFQKKEQMFQQAAESGDYKAVERLNGVQNVYVREEYIDIQCGGSGFGPSTHYYGIFYSEDDDLCAIDVAGPLNELIENGDGYLYKQKDGDNQYYVEPLGNHFYYYEAHY